MPYRKTTAQRIDWLGATRTISLTCGSLLLLGASAARPARAEQQLPAQANAVRRQLTPPAQPQARPATAPKPAPQGAQAPGKKPGSALARATAAPKAPSKSALAPANPASKAIVKASAPGASAPGATESAAASSADLERRPAARRDPFAPLITAASKGGPALPEHLPPGKAGLIISTLHVDGIVSGPNGMIAIVSNPQQRVYFLRQGDRLYDGAVDRIALTTVSFHETGKDPFGKPVEREISKALINPTLGEAP